MSKRKASSAIVGLEFEEIQTEKPIILKSKRDKKDVIFLIEESLARDDEDSVIDNLLVVDIATVLHSFDEIMDIIKQLWKKYQNKLTICTIIINVLTKLIPLVTNLSKDHQMFILSLITHRKLLWFWFFII